MSAVKTSYSSAIREAHHHLLSSHPEVFAIGQGLWSPWYVGDTMTGLEVKFGRDRVIDSPVSEQAATGAALGAALCGYRPIVTHPRVDFAVLALDQIVNQAAKWSSMFGGKVTAPVTFRCIINRGGEQGAQHSQSLFSWFAHVPGLRVVVPYSPTDARDLFIASVMSPDPVVYIDDRWLYELEEVLPSIRRVDLSTVQPRCVRPGTDVTLVGAGYATKLNLDAADLLARDNISCDVIDLRVVNPLRLQAVVSSVRMTGRLCVVDGDWSSCGLAGEVIAAVAEKVAPAAWLANPTRVTLPNAPAPTSRPLEASYYPSADTVRLAVRDVVLAP
jgi:acetoin:2,6-dichlorophenolindophenol oxidoreductase subunit beta